MIEKVLVVQATLVALVNSFSVLPPPYFYQQPVGFQQPFGFQQLPFDFQQQPFGFQQPVASGFKELSLRNEDQSLACPWEGFFVHPQNCTRFYRCVDYAGTGYLFSRYLFECPTNHVFVNEAQTCLPGVCTGLPVQPPVRPITQAPVTPAPSSAPTVSPQTEDVTTWPTQGPVSENPSTESPAPQTDSPATADTQTDVATESPTEAPTTVLPSPQSPPVEECPDAYVQHAEYCNIYHPCKDANERYVCPAGTAFDQPRQMCRINAQDDSLCTGKAIFQDPLLLRTENIGSHILLPASFILPPVRPANNLFRQNLKPFPTYVRPLPTASPEQLYLWPTSRPTANPFEHGNMKFRPLEDRPASVYNHPFQFSSSFQPAFNDISSPFFREQESRPLEQIRRPLGHLHFPQFLAPDAFGFQRDITLE